MSLIHLSIALELFSVLSTFFTNACFCVDLLEMALNCKSKTEGSLCFAAGSSRIVSPSFSLVASGLGTLKMNLFYWSLFSNSIKINLPLIKASISPTAGM